jgi:hypothetical protein
MFVAAGCTLWQSRAPAFMPGFFAFGACEIIQAPGANFGKSIPKRRAPGRRQEQARGIGGE